MSQALVPSSGPVRSGGTPPAEASKAPDNPLLLVHKFLRGRYWLAILLACLLAPCGAAVSYFALKPEYTSNATIRIAPVLPKVLFESEQSNIMPMFDSYLQTQVSLIASRRIIELAMGKDAWKRAGGTYTNEAIEEFAENLSVLQPKNSQLILVSLTDADPVRAKAGLQAVVDSYMEVYGDTDQGEGIQRLEKLDEHEKSLEDQQKKLIDEIYKEAKEYGTDDLSMAYDFEVKNLQTLQSELEAAKLQLAVLQAVSGKEDSAAPRDYSTLTVDEIGMMDPRMQVLLDQRKDLQRQKDKFSSLRRPESRPEYRSAVEALTAQETEIEAYAKAFRDNALRSAAAGVAGAAGAPGPAGGASPILSAEQLDSKVKSLQMRVDEAKERTAALGQKNVEIKAKRTELDRVQDGLDATKARKEQLNVENSLRGRITPLGEAEVPTSPSNAKRRIQFIILSGLAGGGLGVGLVLLLGFFNPRIRDIGDAQDIRPRLLGALPLLPAVLTSPLEAMGAAQCVHQIRTILHAHMPHQETLSLTITASNSGAGKTSFALSLGLSFASAGTRTLIIDGDVLGTGLTRRTGASARCKLGHVLRKYEVITEEESRHALDLARQSGRPIGRSLLDLGYISEMDLEEGLSIQEDAGLGLADALEGELIENCLADIGVPNLTILPASKRTQIPTNAMSPVSVRTLLDKLRSSFDVILIDAGPIPGTTDATIMTSCADGVIMVTSRGDQGSDIQRALRHLHDLNVFVVGLVFNRAEPQDIERSRYSTSVSRSKDDSSAKRPLPEEGLPDLAEILESVAGMGPLPQSVWLSTMHPAVFTDSGVRI